VTPTRLAAVIGSPVEHSLSPVIHRAAFESAGADWTYVAFEVASGSAPAAIDAMRVLGIAGLSVTMPHKDAVAGAVDRLDAAAAALGAVNTVSWDGAELIGSSTDGAGFVASLRDAGVSLEGARCAVLGAGGAARSVIDALDRVGVERIAVVNRTPDRAQRAITLSERAHLGSADDIGIADLVVNATSVGMGVHPAEAAPSSMPCDPALLATGQVVADLVYHPLETAWLAAARARGAIVVDGLGMLVHQAALQQELWLGRAADTTVMRAAATAELRSRTRPGEGR
jgi:shikimate dehydrogenase